MTTRFEVVLKEGQLDARGLAVAQQARALGVEGLERVDVSDLYFLDTDGPADEARAALESLVVDPVIQRLHAEPVDGPAEGWVVEVAPRPGVTDSAGESLILGAGIIGHRGIRAAATGVRYRLSGALSREVVERLARGLLANEVVQSYAVDGEVASPLQTPVEPARVVETVPLRAATDEELMAISKSRRLSLDESEMAAIRAWYNEQDRDPTDVELEMLAQTWSEHCVHKTFRATIDYTERSLLGSVVETKRVDGLLNSHIRRATEEANRDWIVSAFVDNAGIIRFDDDFDIAFKVETHNHPSALEPFGGANTGVGGVVRDIMGVSARPIANTDVLCFGPPDLALEALPEGVLHPQRIADGVISGIEDYGNKMGIPTVNGAVFYDPDYTANPLVYCGCLGILPRDSHRTDPQVGDRIIAFGGRTGRDGLRGATFSSMEMDHTTGEIAGASVQIGHPIHEKQAMEVVLAVRDAGLYTAITDCGAGGLSSAVGEMAETLGAAVDLDSVPLKYAGLQPWEIWLSEAQERMVIAVPPENIDAFAAIAAQHAVEWCDLGTFTGDQQLVVRHRGEVVAQLSTQFLHDGRPNRELKAEWRPPATFAPSADAYNSTDVGETLLALLALPNHCSRAPIVHQYDHEVQGGTLGKPLVGDEGHGDAAVLSPLDAWKDGQPSARGVALSNGLNPRYGRLDPKAMAWAAVDEAVRNAVCVGADPDQMALLDNFCWGNPALPDRLGGLVRCSEGCYEAAVAYRMPFVSGKDSLNNEFTDASGQKQAIPGTILISAVGIVPDVSQRLDAAPGDPGDLVYLLGFTHSELGASALLHHLGMPTAGQVPKPTPGAIESYRLLHAAILRGLFNGAHDVSEGGLALALAEMVIAGPHGIEADLSRSQGADGLGPVELAFSESQGRIVLTAPKANAGTIQAHFAGQPLACLGQVTESAQLKLTAGATDVAVVSREDLREAFGATN